MNQFHPNRTNASGALFFGIAALLSSLMGDLMAALVLGAAGIFLGVVTRKYAAPDEGGGLPITGIALSAAGLLMSGLIFALLMVGGLAAPAAGL